MTSPSEATVYSNTDTFELEGSCETGSIVFLNGDLSPQDMNEPSNQLSMECLASVFRAVLSKQNDGTFEISVAARTGESGPASAAVVRTWIRDTVVPATVTLVSPAANPFLSFDDSVNVSGTCDEGATVNLSGDETASAACSQGAFSFEVSRTQDSEYNFELRQTDRAGNVSAPLAFRWVRDSSVPATPSITFPAVNPFHSNLASITISGACASGLTVTLAGAESQSIGCETLAYSFVLNATLDGPYDYTVYQTSAAGVDSASSALSWVLDRIAPDPPSIVSPGSSPYRSGAALSISGSCEANATVSLTRDSGEALSSVACSAGTYLIERDESSDGEYSYRIAQADRAGNLSSSSTLVWNRDTTAPSAPTLVSPSSNPHLSNSAPLIVSGGCESGAVVLLSGDDDQSTVCVDGGYSFSLSEATHGDYTYELRQNDGINLSGATTLIWNLDLVIPEIQLTSVPANPTVGGNATFEFSSNDPGAGFECQLDGAAFADCASPNALSGLAEGMHLFEVRARDAASNVSPSVSHGWLQVADRSTLALYHFDTGAATADSGSFGNTLVDSGTELGASGRFAQARLFRRSESDLMSANDAPEFATASGTATVEVFLRLVSIPVDPSEQQVIASQSASPSACASNCGWIFGVAGVNAPGRVRVFFSASTDGGATLATIQTGNRRLDVGVWYHLAATFDAGTVGILIDGVQVAGGSLPGTAIHHSSAPLRLGAQEDGAHLDGLLDEFRWSDVVRTVFPPAGPYTSD